MLLLCTDQHDLVFKSLFLICLEVFTHEIIHIESETSAEITENCCLGPDLHRLKMEVWYQAKKTEWGRKNSLLLVEEKHQRKYMKREI